MQLLIFIADAAIDTESNTAEKIETFVVVVIGIVAFFVANAYFFEPLLKKIKDNKAENKKDTATLPAELQNEIFYAEYLEWVAKNGYEVRLKKSILNTTNI